MPLVQERQTSDAKKLPEISGIKNLKVGTATIQPKITVFVKK
jgi:hypothetical protein